MAKLILSDLDSGYLFQLTHGPEWDVIGGGSTTDSVHVAAGVSGYLQLGSGAGDTVILEGGPADYLVSRIGSKAVFTHIGTSATVEVAVAGTIDNIVFDPDANTDGDEREYTLQASAAGVLLGTQVLTLTPTAITDVTNPDDNSTVSLDGHGTASVPYTLDLDDAPYDILDSGSTANNVIINGFSADDTLTYTATSAQDVAVQDNGDGSITVFVNSSGIVSQTTFMDVNPDGALVYDVASFNSLTTGDIVFAAAASLQPETPAIVLAGVQDCDIAV